MTGASGASLSGAFRVVICWQNSPRPKLMRLRRSVRLDGSFMGPAILHTVFGEHAAHATATATALAQRTPNTRTGRKTPEAERMAPEHSSGPAMLTWRHEGRRAGCRRVGDGAGGALGGGRQRGRALGFPGRALRGHQS